jgi:ribosomal-protein-alanine N-acetyltransferase
VSEHSNNQASDTWQFSVMRENDVDEVLAIEQRVHVHPWTRGNFIDSLQNGHTAILMRDAQGRLIGYFLTMTIVDEVHLLDISVDVPFQGQGAGYRLLAAMVDAARAKQMHLVLLEVRVSNVPAIRLYSRYGFAEIGRRKNYYPVAPGVREDAIVMQLLL